MQDWNKEIDYLQSTRQRMWNDDYFEFLVRQVWEIDKPVTWRLGLKIPLSLFIRRTGVQQALSGQVWYGNVYKCADWTSNPCWLMWKKNDGFHNPEGFGAFIFE